METITDILAAVVVLVFSGMIKNVFVSENVFEYALLTRKEKELRRLYNNIFVILILFGLLVLLRVSRKVGVMAYVDDKRTIIAGICTIVYLIGVLVSMFYAWVMKKRSNKNRTENVFEKVLVYVMFISVLGITMISEGAIHPVEIFIYAYIATLTIVVVRAFVMQGDNVDKAILYFDEEYASIDSGNNTKKVYIYHKVENDYILCGDELFMDKQINVMKISDVMSKELKYVR